MYQLKSKTTGTIPIRCQTPSNKYGPPQEERKSIRTGRNPLPPPQKSKMLDYIPGETKKVTGGFYPNQISGVKVMRV